MAQLALRGTLPFSTRDFEGISGLASGRSRQLLSRLVEAGKVHRLQRGLYRLAVPSGEAVPFATHLAAAAGGDTHFLSFRTALERHGLLGPRPKILQVATASARDPREVLGLQVEFVLVSPRFLHGFATFQIGGLGALPMATPERALIEAFRRPDLVGGFEEAVKALGASRGRVDAAVILSALRLPANRFGGATQRRVGFLMELGGLATREQLAPLQAGLSRSYERLNPLEDDGSRDSKTEAYHWSSDWRICRNAEVDRLRRILMA